MVGRRLDDHWKLFAEARVFTGPAASVEWWLLGDSYAQLRLAYLLEPPRGPVRMTHRAIRPGL